MLKALFGWLLWFYPADFRKRYREEYLQLLADRILAEHGLLQQCRLFWDLSCDLLVALPKAYRKHWLKQPAHRPAAATPQGPTFTVLPRTGLHAGTLLWAGAASAVIFWLFGSVVGAARHSLLRWDFLGHPAPQSGRTTAHGIEPRNVLLSQNAQSYVIHTVAADVRRFYFDRATGERTAEALLSAEDTGEFGTADSPGLFAAAVTARLRAASHDPHLILEYRPEGLPEFPRQDTAAEQRTYEAVLLAHHCFFSPVEQLRNGIRLVQLDAFADLPVCAPIANQTMGALRGSHAIIFDLRGNRGGDPAMVMLIASNFFDHPEYMFNPREAVSEHLWTHSTRENAALANTPLYLLTSRRTFSAAEQFAYDMQALRRATIVGETTGGGAHAGVLHRVNAHFGVGIPQVRSLNPFSRSDWEGVGVQPDVKATAEGALEVAQALAEARH